jgi:hypothetical protein
VLCILEYVRAEEYDVVCVSGHSELNAWCVVLLRWSVSSAALSFEPLLWVMYRNKYRANKWRLAPTVRVGLINLRCLLLYYFVIELDSCWGK